MLCGVSEGVYVLSVADGDSTGTGDSTGYATAGSE